MGSPVDAVHNSLVKVSQTAEQRQQLQEECKLHLEAYRRQVARGGHFVHELPMESEAWQMPE
eukprot:4377393-Amphidinium_carterae.1